MYRASERNLSSGETSPAASTPDPAPTHTPTPTRTPTRTRAKAAASKVAPLAEAAEPLAATTASAPVIIYTDGACSGNPGPMGIGVVIMRDGQRQEIGEFLGTGTNNIAELTAVERALDALAPIDRLRQVLVHTDSSYSIGVLAGGFKAKKNVELIAEIRAKCAKFPRLRFVKVSGHAGVPENERCDELAREAVSRRR